MPASDSKAMTLEASEARTISANIVRLLDTKCIHLDGRDPAWRQLFTQRGQDLENSRTALEFERTVNELLTQGGLSHVAFFHETGNRAPARYAINATFTRRRSPERSMVPSTSVPTFNARPMLSGLACVCL